MPHRFSPSLIERIAEKLHIIPGLHEDHGPPVPRMTEPGDLADYPPLDRWDDWVEYEARLWPRREARHYMIVPTACFNCEAGCGLLSYVDKETMAVRKFEGNPYHPGSRGRNCAKGPATINQITDPERVLYPLKRTGRRGEGGWQRVSWDEVLDDIAGRIRKALQEERNNEIAYFADYVLPMGHASERHDFLSYETHSGTWIAFRQPVLREVARRMGKPVEFTYEANPGEVWEEDEFWIELSWRIDPDGSLGIKEHFLSPYRPGEKITVEEYYRYIFEHTPGLPEKAAEEDLAPLEYMRKYGVFEVEQTAYDKHLKTLSEEELKGTTVAPETNSILKDGKAIGVMVDGVAHTGFPTPSRKQEFYSQTMVDWGWPEYKIPVYIKSHVHDGKLDREKGEVPLVPTFRLPTLIHSRSANAKWLNEISNRNPVWMHTSDAVRLGVSTGDMVRVNTEIGYFVDRVWVTEGMKPGVVACSHHLGRWRRAHDTPSNSWGTSLVSITQPED